MSRHKNLKHIIEEEYYDDYGQDDYGDEYGEEVKQKKTKTKPKKSIYQLLLIYG
jgi:hypothetical protein